jgi:hypothetical protein
MSVVADGVNRNIFIVLRSMLAVYYVRLQWKSHGENTVNGHYNVIFLRPWQVTTSRK